MKQFTNFYPLQKTLRFELKPIGNTLDNLKASGILDRDEERALDYKKMKEIIDEYHKKFIEDCLSSFDKDSLNDFNKALEKYNLLYRLPKLDPNRVENLPKIQAELRSIIVKCFTKSDPFKNLFGKDLIQKDLLDFVSGNEKLEADKDIIKKFKNFTTYFKGFQENRRNMYSADAKSTAIAYRLINENLPKFIDNIAIFEKVKNSDVSKFFNELYSNMEDYLNVSSIDEMFDLSYFIDVLTQEQIDVYNAIIGGKVQEDQTKIQGLNEYINLYNQKQSQKDKKLPRLKPLFKQILSDKESLSWLSEEYTKDSQVLDSINEYCTNLLPLLCNDEKSLFSLLKNISEYDLNHIYIHNDTQLTDISQKLFGSWSIITQAIENNYISTAKIKIRNEKLDEKMKKQLASVKSYSMGELNRMLQEGGFSSDAYIDTYFASLGNTDVNKDDLFVVIRKNYDNLKTLLDNYPQDRQLSQDKATVEKIKTLLDSIKELQWFVKPLLGNGDEPDKDNRFYSEFSEIWEQLNLITSLYNKVRNYMTKKPYSEEKIKVNFDNATLLDGWDLNKESANTCSILRKDGFYYLVIMNKNYNKVFDVASLSSDGECYEKMEYKLLPGANKMLPKVFFSKSRIGEFKPSEELLRKYELGTHKKGVSFNIEDCHNLIDFFKQSIEKHEDWSKFNFKFSDTCAYKDLNDFYSEVEQQGYKISFRDISVKYIDKLVEEGKIYLFQIYNKDFSKYSKGTPNMHTLYWQMLFDENNLKDVVYKLNGEAEIFFRKSSIKINKPTHPANMPIANKNPLTEKKQSVFPYDLIKDKRYTVDKLHFHVPITLNFKSPGIKDINTKVNDFIANNGIEHIIGIDRGERHLLYLSLIDLHGNIKEQFSLNVIETNEHKTDYHQLLKDKECGRDEARKSWQTIENIKELKEGYLSQVVHQIAKMMVKYKAIVVLEDLNMGFKRSRQKVEKQVYQKFEKMLIDKLNYLVDKKARAVEYGGLLNAYQLTNKFESFDKAGKQSGFLFYIPAWNTSKMDPTTGFVNLFDTRYESVEKSRNFFDKFDSIVYNETKDWFEFSFDYNNFTHKAEGTKTNWTICTYGSRIETKRDSSHNNQFVSKEVDLTELFKSLFNQFNIDLGINIKESIIHKNDKTFFEKLLHLLHLTLQMRNSKTGTEVDYLISPVMNHKGVFYDSRSCDNSQPKDADANGAYNIARKGLWVVEQIKQSADVDKPKIAISNKEWLRFVQSFDK